MKLYHFNSPKDLLFAQATRRGTWFPIGGTICTECNTSRQRRVSPLIIEWEAGSDVIGDFIWPGLNNDLVVSQKVKNVLQDQFHEIDFGPVEFWQSSKLRQPSRQTKRTKPRVWLPYTGPILWDVIPNRWCHLDHIRSNVTILKVCSTCGKTIYKIPERSHRYMVVDTNTWKGENIFHIHEYSGAIFCTEKVKEIIQQAGFSNVSFIEDGEIPD